MDFEKAVSMQVALRHFLFCTATLLFLSTVPAVADLEAGKRAYQQGDYASALKELRPLAGQGNAEAQALLGVMYNLGRGVPQDFGQARKWYKAAADQGNAEAQCHLGSMYLRRDTAEGLKLLRLSAEQGFIDAYLILGMAYMNLKNARDLVEADMWLTLAEAHGDPLARSQRSQAESRMSRDQVIKARSLAAVWKPKTGPASGSQVKN